MENISEILVTGAAGFIGYHLCQRLASEGYEVVGVDNINDYYSVQLKEDRLGQLQKYDNFHFQKVDIAEREALEEVFSAHDFSIVYNLAAQAGVRYSLENPQPYFSSNLEGFFNILEEAKEHEIGHLIYASSSSVYGLNKKQPYSVHETANHPTSLYAATKKSNELMAHSYSHLYDMPTTGLRFFTVYGPWGRPDMAYYLFVRKILNGEQIEIFNHGDMARDFTYVDDIVESLYRIKDHKPEADPAWNAHEPDPCGSTAPYCLYNIGNNQPVDLMEFVDIIQDKLGRSADIEFLPMQPGDVKETWADSSDLYEVIDYSPDTGLEEGIGRFVDWYREYNSVLQPE